MFDAELPAKTEEILQKQGDWKCKNCSTENDATDVKCAECQLDRRFSSKEIGTPSQNWRELRELYKTRIINDVPEKIPESISRYLRSDIERYLYKRARMLVNLCLEHGAWNEEYDKVEILQQRLQDLDMGNVTGSMRNARMIDYLEEIYWTASMHMCDVLSGPSELDGYMDLLLHSRYRGGNKYVLDEKFENFKQLPKTIKIKGSKRDPYWLNLEQKFCSCPAFKYRRGLCKHLQKHMKQK